MLVRTVQHQMHASKDTLCENSTRTGNRAEEGFEPGNMTFDRADVHGQSISLGWDRSHTELWDLAYMHWDRKTASA